MLGKNTPYLTGSWAHHDACIEMEYKYFFKVAHFHPTLLPLWVLSRWGKKVLVLWEQQMVQHPGTVARHFTKLCLLACGFPLSRFSLCFDSVQQVTGHPPPPLNLPFPFLFSAKLGSSRAAEERKGKQRLTGLKRGRSSTAHCPAPF